MRKLSSVASPKKFAPVAFMAFMLLVNVNAFASRIGNDHTAGAWTYASDSNVVLVMQLQNSVLEAGTLDSFSVFSGSPPCCFTAPFEFHALVFRPTGNPNEYNILFDSGAYSFDDEAIHSVSIAPVAVLAGDIIGHWGRGIGFHLTGGFDTTFHNGAEFNTPFPSGTFTAFSGTYPAYTSDREYGISFNFEPATSQVPEPATISLLGIGVTGLAWMKSR